MCGIAGAFGFDSPVSKGDIVLKMTDALSHRGPDADGFYHENGVSLGHRRLSIIDLSDTANQPLFDSSGNYVIVFNGEIYNFKDIKADLHDYPFKTNGDTEVLLAAYIKWGQDCISKLKGMFAFAIWNKGEGELFICRDRMGVKPLYFYEGNDIFLFSSEVRSLLASGVIPRRIDRDALLDYFSFQSFSCPDSPIMGVKQLEPGSYLRVKVGKKEKGVYWRLYDHGGSGSLQDESAIKKEIKRLLTNAVERRLVSDVPIGAFLSGGIDSSAVVGLMAEVSSSRPHTFNISFAERAFDESKYAETVAKKFGRVHNTIRLNPDVFLMEVENALSAMDTPSADGVNTYVVSKAIRKAGISVALSGVGGDELFAGYPFFKTFLKLQSFSGLFERSFPLRKASESLLRGISNVKFQRILALMPKSDLAIEKVYPEFRRILTRSEISRLTSLTADQKGTLESGLISLRQEFSRLPKLSQVTAAEYLGYTQNTLLKDTDQMSMAVSLEVREPFFDHDLIEYLLMVPDKFKNPSYPKSLLVESLKPLLPDSIVHRRKQGFLFPWEFWLRNQLHDFAEENIMMLGESSIVNSDAVVGMWNNFLSRRRPVRWTEVWLFVVLGYWMKKNDITG